MTPFIKTANILETKVTINSGRKDAFISWQADMNAIITEFPGFISLEILALLDSWVIVQRFSSAEKTSSWVKSEERKKLLEDLKKIGTVEEIAKETSSLKTSITEMLITEVAPEQEEHYRNWIAKMHGAEAKFAGFLGVYVQAPDPGCGKNWITLLQFDTEAHLDAWLNSNERKKHLQEGAEFIHAIESHRVISPYAGWFASIAKLGELPAVSKQTMLVLLVLFPVVMLEFKYLNPHLQHLNISVGTFIGNAISVSLISWPLMPLAITALGFWLAPRKSGSKKITILGIAIIFGLYLIEIAFFWSFV